MIGLKAVNCETGDVLAETQGEAASKEGVLNALDAAAVSMREQAGGVAQLGAEVRHAARRSDHAIAGGVESYSLGHEDLVYERGRQRRLPLLKRAVELDPNFAVAYAGMSAIYDNLGEASGRPSIRARHTNCGKRRAKWSGSPSRQLPRDATGDVEKAVQVIELWHQTYPRDAGRSGNSDSCTPMLGNHEKALKQAQESLPSGPHSEIYYIALGSDYMPVNRLDEAEAVLKEARSSASWRAKACYSRVTSWLF